MNNHNDKSKLKPQYRQHSDNQPHKRNLLLRFIVFMAWVAAIGLLLSLFACTPVNDNVSRSEPIHLQAESLEDLLVRMLKGTNRPLLMTGYSREGVK